MNIAKYLSAVKLGSLLISVLLFNAATAQTEAVRVANSELRQLYSQKVGQQYQILINLPMAYDKNKQYPVIYLLDAQWDFPLVSAIYGQLYYDGFVPAAIIAGITWSKDDNPDVKRVRDFSPSKMESDIETGGAAKFLSFIQTELIPFMHQQYGANDQRVLMGSSMGGLFTLYALFSEPGLFKAYIPTASASGWDNNVLFQIAKNNEQNIRKTLNEHAGSLYSAVGELDHLKSEFVKMQAFLGQQDYPGLQIKTQILPELGHAGIKSAGNAWGLMFAFQKPDLKLSADELNQWIGTYQNSDNTETLVVSIQNERLSIQRNDQVISHFQAASGHEFYQHGQFYQLDFEHQAPRGINLTIERFGNIEHFRLYQP